MAAQGGNKTLMAVHSLRSRIREESRSRVTWPVSDNIKGEYLVKNTTDIRIDVIFYD